MPSDFLETCTQLSRGVACVMSAARLDCVCARACVCGCVFFTVTDRASALPNNMRGCQSGTWSVGQENIRGTSTKLQREHQNEDKKTKTTKERNKNTKHMP